MKQVHFVHASCCAADKELVADSEKYIVKTWLFQLEFQTSWHAHLGAHFCC